METSPLGAARFVLLPPASIGVEAGNPRVHSDEQVSQIVASVRQFGWTNPLLIDECQRLIAGAARLSAAHILGMETVPCIVLTGLSESQRRAYRVADNQLALNATWDEDLLRQVLRDLDGVSFDLPVLGFDDAEIARLLEPETEPLTEDPAPPPEVPVTQLGDVWLLGEHRLICGDSTKSETFEELFASGPRAGAVVTDPPHGAEPVEPPPEWAGLVFTDPPYGMAYDGGQDGRFGMILGDDAKGEDLVNLVAGALQAGAPFVSEGAAWYVCFTWRTWREFAAALARAELAVAACIVWDKQSTGLGFQHYRGQHEFVFYSPGKRWHGGRSESDVWQFSRGNTVDYVHPTQKPVALLERAIRNSTRAGDVVLDMFGGSGSTLIACDRLGRRARLVELDPRYCDAIVRRWEKLTGKTAARGGAL